MAAGNGRKGQHGSKSRQRAITDINCISQGMLPFKISHGHTRTYTDKKIKQSVLLSSVVPVYLKDDGYMES